MTLNVVTQYITDLHLYHCCQAIDYFTYTAIHYKPYKHLLWLKGLPKWQFKPKILFNLISIYKDYTFTEAPLKHYNQITSFTSRTLFYFGVNHHQYTCYVILCAILVWVTVKRSHAKMTPSVNRTAWPKMVNQIYIGKNKKIIIICLIIA